MKMFRLPLVAFACLTALVAAAPSFAQNTPPPALRVIAITKGDLEVGGIITVKVEGLAAWEAAPATASGRTHDPYKLVPYLDGLPLGGQYPIGVHRLTGELVFPLGMTAANRDIWVQLIGEPKLLPPELSRRVSFSVGLENDTEYAPIPNQKLVIILPKWGAVSFAIIALTIGSMVYFARNTSMLRDGPRTDEGALRPYSLGRVQMAFWFALVFSAYIAIWLITDESVSITTSMIGLMGISAGTALSAVMIDSGKASDAKTQLQAAQADQVGAQASVKDAETQLAALNAKGVLTPDEITARDTLSRQLTELRVRVAKNAQVIDGLLNAVKSDPSRGFWRDIVSDGREVSFHRFQILAWTVALGLVFVSKVYYQLSMPEIGTPMLALMGVSSGTYLGFKIPEKA